MTDTITGRIIKGIGGFYYIKPSGSSCLLEARAVGILRHRHQTPTVGDYVEAEGSGGQYTLTKILPRKNIFVRPPVANVDLAVITFAFRNPRPNLLLLDELLVNCELRGVDAVICLTKEDLAKKKDFRILDIYQKTGYPIVISSQSSSEGVKKLRAMLKDKTAFFAGPSGVGKSTLTNALCGRDEMDTGDLSQKLGRGKHTTRHVELVALPYGGYLLDTPGFSSLRPEEMDIYDLKNYFPEFPSGECRFDDCLHLAEPDCAVRAAVEEGKIAKSRYENYCQMIEIIKKRNTY